MPIVQASLHQPRAEALSLIIVGQKGWEGVKDVKNSSAIASTSSEVAGRIVKPLMALCGGLSLFSDIISSYALFDSCQWLPRGVNTE